MNPPAGYEHPEVGEVISKEFLLEDGGAWHPWHNVDIMKIDAHDNVKEWARPKNKHWNSLYSNVKRPDGFRFLEKGETIKRGDKFIEIRRDTFTQGTFTNVSDAVSIGDKVADIYFPIIRSINKIPKPKKKTALQLANEKVAALTKELEELKRKVKDFAAEL